MTRSRALRITIFPAIAVLALAACTRKRPAETEEVLLARLARYAHAKIAKDPGAAVDVLVVSGGGDWGAFGTGFLLGWGETASQADRRPTFDVVSGVSTGALIAPFAFLGTTKDLETVDSLYRNPKDDWVRQRGLLFFMPDNASFAEVPGLEREVDRFINMDFARRVAEESTRGRMLFINTTNLDDGSQLPFRWGLAAQRAVKDGDIKRLQNILLASSGIPGAFPPRQVDSWLLVDGAVTSNIIYGGAMRREDSFGASWKRLYPQQPVPKLRYWVLLNNYAVAQPRTVQPNWPSVIERSLEVAVRASTTVALRHLYAMAEVARLRGDGDTEVRWVAIPNSWKAPVEGIFKEPTMRSLSDLGRAMGRDPASWKTESP
jgi:predicted acylesterase/phospholipase RssA